jgi:phosphoribosylanthranilate isomerase
MVFVKICGITNLEDAVASVDAGADALGFNFYPRSVRFIKPGTVREILDRMPREILGVGVFVDEDDPTTVARIADEAGVGAIQLHGNESPVYCRSLQGRYVIKALRVGPEFQPEEAVQYKTQAVLLDTYVAGLHGGSGQAFDWSKARATRDLTPKLFLAGGLSHTNVADAINLVHPYGVDACSRLERVPGRKDAELVRKFVAAARIVC